MKNTLKTIIVLTVLTTLGLKSHASSKDQERDETIAIMNLEDFISDQNKVAKKIRNLLKKITRIQAYDLENLNQEQRQALDNLPSLKKQLINLRIKRLLLEDKHTILAALNYLNQRIYNTARRVERLSSEIEKLPTIDSDNEDWELGDEKEYNRLNLKSELELARSQVKFFNTNRMLLLYEPSFDSIT